MSVRTLRRINTVVMLVLVIAAFVGYVVLLVSSSSLLATPLLLAPCLFIIVLLFARAIRRRNQTTKPSGTADLRFGVVAKSHHATRQMSSDEIMARLDEAFDNKTALGTPILGLHCREPDCGHKEIVLRSQKGELYVIQTIAGRGETQRTWSFGLFDVWHRREPFPVDDAPPTVPD